VTRLLRPLWTAALLLVLAAAGPANAVQVTADPASKRIDLSERMTLLRDPQRSLDLDAVLAMPQTFQSVSRQDLVTGFNPGAFWLRITLQADGDWPLTRWLVVGTAKTQRVTLFQREGNSWRTFNSGRSISVHDRPLETLDPVFPLTLAPGVAQELLLRVDSRGATDMASSLWEPEAYRHETGKQQMRLTAILAGLLVSGALALLAFAAVRERQYLWLGLFLWAISGLEATRSNFLGTYLWPTTLAQPAQVLPLFALIAVFGLSKVAEQALELAQRMPKADRLLFLLRWSGVAGALLSLFSYGHGVLLLSIAATLQNVAILAVCVLAWARGHAAAGFFLMVLSLALLTEISRQFANLGLLPWIAAMEFSTFLFLLASPLILYGLIEQTRRLSMQLQVAQQLQEAKSAFLARVSHELRSPLSTLLGFNRMLARRSDNLSIEDGTAEIEKSALRLLRQIDELLDEARTAAGQLTVSPAPLRLGPWLDEIARDARLITEANGNGFALDVAGALPANILADGERLRQVIDNLLANANRHTHGGSLRLECRPTIQADTVTLEFAVADDGEGIAAECLESIFRPFDRGGLRGDHDGVGLGLPICRELVRQMGGEISVISSPGKGSRFAFTLGFPIVADYDTLPPVCPEARHNTGSTAIATTQWQQLARLTDEGDVSGIADWLTARRAEHPEQAGDLDRVEHALRQLDFATLRRFGTGLLASSEQP